LVTLCAEHGMAWRDWVLFTFSRVGLTSYQYRWWDGLLCDSHVSLRNEVTPSMSVIGAAVTQAIYIALSCN
jgi:hypothetical protein